MNRTKIEWVDDIWNPITGCCYSCEYCYARKNSVRFSGDIRKNLISKKYSKEKELYILDTPFTSETGGILNYPFGFMPTVHKYRLNYPQKRKNGCNILVGEMGDMFGPWVPEEWIEEVLAACIKRPIHNYLFLTKNPERYWELEEKGMLPAGENMWYGYSMPTSNCQGWSSINGDKNNFICVEPLLEDLNIFDENMLCPAAKWVIIGAETGVRKNKVEPKKEWIDKIVQHCDKFHLPVFMKESLIDIVGKNNMRREFPKQLSKKQLSEKVEQRLYANCCCCKAYQRKSDMITLAARSCRGEQPKQFGFMCKKCFENFCKSKELELPKLKNLENMEEN